jgi:hypothetical protein
VVLDVVSELTPAARDRVDLATHLPWGITSPVELPLETLPRRPWVAVPVRSSRATPEEWIALFGPREMPPHRLGADQLRLVGVATQALGGDVPAAMRRLAAGHIDATAERISPTRTWDDLVLDACRGAIWSTKWPGAADTGTKYSESGDLPPSRRPGWWRCSPALPERGRRSPQR